MQKPIQILLFFFIVNLTLGETLLPTQLNTSLRDNYSGTLGMDFVISSDNSRIIDSLGFYDNGHDGLQTNHRVGIWNNNTGAKIAEVTIESGVQSYLYKGFRYEPINSGPVTLSANTAYTIGAETFTALDPWLKEAKIQLNKYYVGDNSWWCRWGSGFEKPTGGQGQAWTEGYIYGTVNMTSLKTTHDPNPQNAIGTKVGIPAGNNVEVSISFNTARDPLNLNQVNQNITGHYLYIVPDTPDFSSVTPINLPAGGLPPDETVHYTATLNENTLYYWRVDESINNSTPGDTQTITGPLWSFKTVEKKDAQVSIDPNTLYQVFDGFGTSSMHSWTSEWYNTYSTQVLEGFLDMCYTLDNNGLGAEICRFFMPHGDNPTHDHMSIPDCANASFEPEDGVFDWVGHECILWLARGAAQRGCKMLTYQLGPPYWLTVSGCTAGSVDGTSNNIIAGQEARYAKHICDVLKHFRDSWNIDFDYVTAMGEPEADWWLYGGYQPGCHVSTDQAVTILRELAAKLDEYNLKAQIVAPDVYHTNEIAHRDAILSSDVEANISILTTHQYWNDNPTTMQQWYDKAQQYDKKLWQTEWGNWWDDGYPDNNPIEQAQSYAEKIHNALKYMHANVWIIWEMAFLLDEETSGLFPRKSYWPVAHYSRHVRPGMQSIKSVESRSECLTTVWVDPKSNGYRKLVIVTYNNSDNYVDIDYDMSNFPGAQVLEVKRSLLNAYSPEENYIQTSFEQISDGTFSLLLPQRAIVTITVEFSSCDTYIAGDFTGKYGQPDCRVDYYDIYKFIQSWLQIDPNVNLSDKGQQPLNHIDIYDLSEFAANWLKQVI